MIWANRRASDQKPPSLASVVSCPVAESKRVGQYHARCACHAHCRSKRRADSSVVRIYGYRSYRLQAPLDDCNRLAADASFEHPDAGTAVTGCDRESMRSKQCIAGSVVIHPPGHTGHAATSQIDVVMILPQVHLRKPCYDFTFL
jgi:hypothetical protein